MFEWFLYALIAWIIVSLILGGPNKYYSFKSDQIINIFNKIKSNSGLEFIQKLEEIAVRLIDDKITGEKDSIFTILETRLNKLGVLSFSKKPDSNKIVEEHFF